MSKLSRIASAGPEDSGWRVFLASLTPQRVLVALLLAVLAALALKPIFITPLPVLLGRTLFVGLLALLAFCAAAQWPARLPPWCARWGLQVAAVALTVPVATLLAYLVSVEGDLVSFLRSEGRIRGFMWIAGAGLLLGPLLALGALYRQRDAEARSERLRFELERSELERQALDARLRVLQAQVEPHFLFNTLANVRMLVETGSPRAAPVLRSLIAYLRAAMPRLTDEVSTLGDELLLVQAYLDLMHLRMPDRLRFEVQVDAQFHTLRFPPAALLTLVENAIRHGIDPSEEGGQVQLGARREGQQLRLWVLDTGVGLTHSMGSGTGLKTLRERLLLFFGPEAALELAENPGGGVRAEIRLPLA
ncbi:sensor histidine kinase [Roseateles sp. BYS180W]|uniref:Sensor histidine kinase n=1 Tax=Roseateles rivi TaxID=3299028 RepID=A0ABW7FYU6_9BURK